MKELFGSWGGVAIYFVAFAALFYFLIIMPRKRQEKTHKSMMTDLSSGDKIVTIGGIKGKITKVDDESVRLMISDNTEIELLKKAIAYIEKEE